MQNRADDLPIGILFGIRTWPTVHAFESQISSQMTQQVSNCYEACHLRNTHIQKSCRVQFSLWEGLGSWLGVGGSKQ